jgi:hypothetical protein
MAMDLPNQSEWMPDSYFRTPAWRWAQARWLFGPQPLGYRPAPGLWAKLVALVFLAAVVAFGIVASWGD